MQRTARDDETLAWLDFSLRWAGAKDRPQLARILEAVRAEVVFEMELAEEAALESLKQAGTG